MLLPTVMNFSKGRSLEFCAFKTTFSKFLQDGTRPMFVSNLPFNLMAILNFFFTKKKNSIQSMNHVLSKVHEPKRQNVCTQKHGCICCFSPTIEVKKKLHSEISRLSPDLRGRICTFSPFILLVRLE